MSHIVYSYPLCKERKYHCQSEKCYKRKKEISATYSYSRQHPWVKGPGYMDRYREPDAATRVRHGSFWDFYVCPKCGVESGEGPNTWKEPSDIIL